MVLPFVAEVGLKSEGKTAYYSHIYGVKILWCHCDQRNLLQPLSSTLKMVVAGLTKRKVYLYRNKLHHVPSNTVVSISSWVFAIAMFFLFHVVRWPEDNLLNFCCVRCKCHRYNMYVSTYFFVIHAWNYYATWAVQWKKEKQTTLQYSANTTGNVVQWINMHVQCTRRQSWAGVRTARGARNCKTTIWFRQW